MGPERGSAIIGTSNHRPKPGSMAAGSKAGFDSKVIKMSGFQLLRPRFEVVMQKDDTRLYPLPL